MFNPKQSNTGIKWSWLALSFISLLTGMIYLSTTNLVGPAQVAQDAVPVQDE